MQPNLSALDLFIQVARGDLTPEEAESIRVSRDARWKEMYDTAIEYYRLIDNPPSNPEEMERVKRKLDKLSAPFTDNPAYAAHLALERQMALKEDL